MVAPAANFELQLALRAPCGPAHRAALEARAAGQVSVEAKNQGYVPGAQQLARAGPSPGNASAAMGDAAEIASNTARSEPQLGPVPCGEGDAAAEEDVAAALPAVAASAAAPNPAAAEVAVTPPEANAGPTPDDPSPEDKEAIMAASVARVAQRRAAGQRPSQYVGVYWLKSSRGWTAELTHAGTQHRLGTHLKEEDAARAYDAKARLHRGARAHGGKASWATKYTWRLNFPTEAEVAALEEGLPPPPPAPAPAAAPAAAAPAVAPSRVSPRQPKPTTKDFAPAAVQLQRSHKHQHQREFDMLLSQKKAAATSGQRLPLDAAAPAAPAPLAAAQMGAWAPVPAAPTAAALAPSVPAQAQPGLNLADPRAPPVAAAGAAASPLPPSTSMGKGAAFVGVMGPIENAEDMKQRHPALFGLLPPKDQLPSCNLTSIFTREDFKVNLPSLLYYAQRPLTPRTPQKLLGIRRNMALPEMASLLMQRLGVQPAPSSQYVAPRNRPKTPVEREAERLRLESWAQRETQRLRWQLADPAAPSMSSGTTYKAPATSRLTSSYVGVSWHQPTASWKASISVGRTRVRWDKYKDEKHELGSFQSEEDAARAYDDA